MKKTITLLACLAATAAVHAIPADPTPARVAQAGGDSLTVTLVGDEFYHYYTTGDGRTVLDLGNRWEYAVADGDRLAPSGVAAHDPGRRTPAENAFVASLPRHLTATAAVQAGHRARAARDSHRGPNREPVVDYDTFRGLIVLINYTDRKFQMNNPATFYDDMVNTADFTGFYTGSGWNRRFNSCTGSMRDYFRDQSLGQFDPQFDIVGPVDVPYASTDGGEHYTEIFTAALQAIDDEVDFTRYDSDNNGEIDMVFFLVAGYSANYGGNSQAYLWPHMSQLYGFDEQRGYYYLTFDGMVMGRYASSTEIYGWESYGMTTPNGIGTMCHEFSHVLGLPDLYDTDYAGSGGESNHPGEWDVMASGSSGNQGRTPVGYSLWERTELGWATATTLDEGNYSLTPIASGGRGYVLPTPVDGETFYIENRQQNKWDSQLPGHGLLVARLDVTNPQVWWYNTVNADPTHNYYELVRADGSAAFPTNGATSLTCFGTPQLVTWGGVPVPLGLYQIAEAGGTVTFVTQVNNDLHSVVEDFETMQPSSNATGVRGRFARWDFVQASVTDDSDFDSGRECQMSMPAAITMTTDVQTTLFRVSADAANASAQVSKLQLFYSTDGGATWTSAGVEEVPATTTTTVSWTLSCAEPVRLRITRMAGQRTALLGVDNVTLHYTGDFTHFMTDDYAIGDINGDGRVDVDDVNILVNIILGNDQAENYGGRAAVAGGDTVSITDVNALINIVLDQN